MSDLIERLRGRNEYWQHAPLYNEAADEIERLTTESVLKDAIIEDFKQFAAYIALKSEFRVFRKTEEYAAFFDNLKKLDSVSGKRDIGMEIDSE